MIMNLEEKVRERAYHLWLAADKVEGHAEAHWRLAEEAIAREHASVAVDPAPAKAAVRRAPVKGARKASSPKSASAKSASGKSASAKSASGHTASP